MKITECPRDAWQGFHPFIPTVRKAAYINELLKVGFDTIDFGSFVSAKAMPQVSDTALLLDQLDLSGSKTKLLAIVANERGALEASGFKQITYLGYPFSISETFQLRNTNASIEASVERVKGIAEIAANRGKEVVIYISMGFGNPYDDAWEPGIVMEWVEKLAKLGIKIFSLSDTVGMAKTDDISSLFSELIPAYPHLEFGAHFHTIPDEWRSKIEAAYQAGCRRFDGALLGYGGCPMAQDDLVGNMPTEQLIAFAREMSDPDQLNMDALQLARSMFLQLVQK
ncbi:Hydroxymethylglutaryl-CoA lyase YngG [Dyadobacter sp. CECT 9623]|uniref:Hydroxymethylglutaryl-CoA lyase YngG n=1 Tax=Dyadobacter linearis TaxID=2823330 RepID=A0ABM8URF3_9BACT|nr:hydroxymethylglutaryl-CoA lyase [Dyadobacter sp. CECT 9623]CAG5070102.1 Hydroxymethylglutaryl-CoA lyase YngG [Dyadobacter sp. CECT 9623]